MTRYLPVQMLQAYLEKELSLMLSKLTLIFHNHHKEFHQNKMSGTITFLSFELERSNFQEKNQQTTEFCG